MEEHLLKKNVAAKCSVKQMIIKISKTVKLNNYRDLAIKSLTCFVVWVFGRFSFIDKIACDCSIESESSLLPRSNQDQHSLDRYSCNIRFPKKSTTKPLKKSQKAAK